MYKAIKFSIIFFSFALLSGCASSCGSAVETNSNGSNTSEIIVPKKASNVSVPTNSNGNTKMVPYSGSANTNGPNPTMDNSKVKVIDTTDPSKVKPPPKKKMPDNSEISAGSVGRTFVETREFKDNKDLDKLVRIVDGKNIKVKVYLKNGKVIDLEEGKIKNYKTDRVAQILEAVGMKPKGSDKADEKNTKEKEELKKSKEN